MIWIVSTAHRSQMYTRLENIRSGLATSFATSESLRRQKEQRIVLSTRERTTMRGFEMGKRKRDFSSRHRLLDQSK
jgi:hypothetical protein